jgi:hypothetical protein
MPSVQSNSRKKMPSVQSKQLGENTKHTRKHQANTMHQAHSKKQTESNKSARRKHQAQLEDKLFLEGDLSDKCTFSLDVCTRCKSLARNRDFL